MSADTIFWLEIWKIVSTFTIAIVAAAVTAIFARRQWKTAQAKLILDLFDRRFAIYQELNQVVAQYNTQGPENTNIEHIMKFAAAKHRSKFLFGEEVYLYLERINKDLAGIRSASSRMKSAEGNKYEKLAQKESEHWAQVDEFYDKIDKLVMPYLKIDQKIP